MSDQQQTDNSPALAAALESQADRLAPGAPAQLTKLWDDLKGQPASVIPDLVAVRLGKDEYRHFQRAAESAQGRQQADAPAEPKSPGEALVEHYRNNPPASANTGVGWPTRGGFGFGI